GGRLTGSKSPVLDGGVADLVIVAARGPDGSGLYLVDLRGPGVARSGLDSVDPTRSLVEIRFEGAPAERLGEAGWDMVDRML
ncbi:acyl-CoA dehydrogenase, partial [Acinetobacter baumannii]